MATRFYFRESSSAPVDVAVTAAWESSAAPFAKKGMFTSTDGADTLTDITAFTSTAGQDRCHRMWISEPMVSGIVFDSSVTYKCQIQCSESAANDNIRSRCRIKIMSQDGATERYGVLGVAERGPNTEWNPTTMRNKTILDGDTDPGAGYTTVTGDRLVIEIGHNDSSGVSISGNSRWGSAGSTDLPENETSTSTTERPWFETSLNITFVAGTEFQEAVDVTATGTVTRGVLVSKLINITVTGSTTRANLTAKNISVTGTGSVANIKQTLKNIATTVTGSAVQAATLIFTKAVDVTVTGSVTNAMNVIFGYLANLTVTGTVTNVKAIGKNIAMTVTGSPARVNAIAKNIVVTVTGSPVMQTLGTFFHSVAVTVTGTVSVARQFISGAAGPSTRMVKAAIAYFYRPGV